MTSKKKGKGDRWRCKDCALTCKSIWNDVPYLSGNTKILFPRYLRLLYAWCRRDLQKSTMADQSLGETTVSHWWAHFDETASIFESNNVVMIGGVSEDDRKNVYLDHTFFSKLRKYDRGYMHAGDNLKCILGGTDSDGLLNFSIAANERQPQTEYLMKRAVNPHSDITTDCGGAFNRTSELLETWTHSQVNHSGTIDPKTGNIHYFKDPVTGACSDAIEGAFGRLKRDVVRFAYVLRSESRFQEFIDSFSFRFNHSGNIAPQMFVMMLFVYNQVYPADGAKMTRYIAWIQDIFHCDDFLLAGSHSKTFKMCIVYNTSSTRRSVRRALSTS